ncbi:hypothetical protein JCM19037_2675 [Geomicrobium sp. JCM 19037]|uniref:hypothetical protein n=1 Tax=unclassified Geomicrobium TaxID=2628951 RepID=UPI00045F19D1|nr:hypothetical protein [Geomicrobium sp. JCM 19037]GAK04284.1 hypothetical protein JCM19037_2675 [Geomicrobium sp. JCM 19037]
MDDKERKYEDFESVESIDHDIIPEDLPEGPYGAPVDKPLGKTEPWEPGQHAKSAFTYENRELHAGRERKDPNAHDPHSEKRGDEAD